MSQSNEINEFIKDVIIDLHHDFLPPIEETDQTLEWMSEIDIDEDLERLYDEAIFCVNFEDQFVFDESEQFE